MFKLPWPRPKLSAPKPRPKPINKPKTQPCCIRPR